MEASKIRIAPTYRRWKVQLSPSFGLGGILRRRGVLVTADGCRCLDKGSANSFSILRLARLGQAWKAWLGAEGQRATFAYEAKPLNLCDLQCSEWTICMAGYPA